MPSYTPGSGRRIPAAAGMIALALAAAALDCGRAGSEEGRGAASDGAAGAWSARIAVDSGGGHVGPWRMNESDWRYVDDPTVAVDDEGRAVVAWVDQARRAVLLQVYGPGGEPRLAEPANVSRSPDVFSWLPRVALGPAGSGRIHLLWQEIVFSGGTHGGEAFYARSADGGRTFSEPVNLSRSVAGDGKGRITDELWFNGSLDLAAAPGGRLYAAWTAYEGGLWLARSADGGESFSAPLRVAGSDSVPARGPSLAAGPGDTVRMAWSAGAGGAGDLRLAVSVDGGRTFGEDRAVHPGPGHADAPSLARAGDGDLHLAWGTSSEGPLRPSRLQHARSSDGGRSFGPPREIAAAHAAAFTSVDYPELASAPGDTVLAAWALLPDGPRFSRGLGMAVSTDGGASFGGSAVVPGTRPRGGDAVTGSLQGFYRRRLATSADGGVALTYSTFRRGEGSRVWLLRGRRDSLVAALSALP